MNAIINEIVKVKKRDKVYDVLIDDELTNTIYQTYFKVLKISKKFKILSYELDGENQEVMYELQHVVKRCRMLARKIYRDSATSNALRMIEEMELYFDWFGQ